MEPRRAASGSSNQGCAVGAGSAAELVYHLAGALGTELQELARRFGPDAAAGLVPLVVRALELLEKAAVGPAPDSLQVSAQQAELELRRLSEENRRLRQELGSGPQEERELLRQLKEVTDRQRDELRAHSRDLMRRSQETEALQEQLQRLLLINSELRYKLAAVQTQLRAAQDRERERQIALDGSRQLAEEQRLKPEVATLDDRVDAPQQPGHPPEAVQCGFTREELEQILQERNELKANVFLLKEELAYFQRELLSDHRVPGLLLEAMKVAVKKQRKKIKAKMLGTPEEAESSDDEDDSWLLLSNDKEDAPLVPGSRIQNLKSLERKQEGVGSCGDQIKPGPPTPLAAMGPGMMVPLLLLWTRGSQESTLDPTGQHVCRGGSPSELQCCPGWRQKDQECSIPVCEGPDACRKDEVCVKPGLCRCKPGFFGAQCSSREFQGLGEVVGQNWPAQASTGAMTAVRPALAIRVASVSQPLVCATVSLPTGAHSDSGDCICLKGWWGPECSRRCQCVRGQCSVSSGHCSCPPGFHGARCELPCDPGHYGAQCRESCGHCAPNATCSPVTGNCESCKPGWNGTQCKQPCPPGTFGERCGEQCPRCWLGEPCHAETGHCQRCDPGWLGDSCNSSCPSGFHGNNCSIPCQCPEGLCHPVSGACQLGHHGKNALIAGILVPLLLVLLGVICCAYCCSAKRLAPKDRPERNGAALFRMKQQVWDTLTSLGAALPCGSLSNYKLPWVTVSHHDPEVPFNHSFIEPPSAGWASDDSFSSDPDSGEEDESHAYSVPPREKMVPVAQEESPAASLPGGPFPPPEDTSTPFPIPRTSSLARAKRPSVSFAEGTKFAPQNGRSSGDLSSPIRKPKRLSRGAQPRPEGQEAGEPAGPEQANAEEDAATATSPGDAATSHHQLPPTNQTVAGCVETSNGSIQESSGSVATIYMLAGTPQKPEGPVWSVLRRLGNYQKDQAMPKVKSAIPKPVRRALGRNQGSTGLSQSSGSAPDAMLSGTIKPTEVRPEEASRGLGDGTESLGTAQEPISGNSSLEQGSQKQAEEKEQEEPLYENVVPLSVPLQH
ncbi:Scavenger receptor class F member 1 [Microtus ochrogaster]|uniref:Rab-interacting lysosomal protein n=1 Tax=Microtus ochrogaster TaxID=79684 RepID=A0A8J6KV94_MICOH|nr:Scavenger receptor class F member 1 [Microtus ochrogaster]